MTTPSTTCPDCGRPTYPETYLCMCEEQTPAQLCDCGKQPPHSPYDSYIHPVSKPADELEQQLVKILVSYEPGGLENQKTHLPKLLDLIATREQAVRREAETPTSTYSLTEVEANRSVGWFTHSGLVFQIIEIGKSARVIGRLKGESQ